MWVHDMFKTYIHCIKRREQLLGLKSQTSSKCFNPVLALMATIGQKQEKISKESLGN